jgi:hypothetical protein
MFANGVAEGKWAGVTRGGGIGLLLGKGDTSIVLGAEGLLLGSIIGRLSCKELNYYYLHRPDHLSGGFMLVSRRYFMWIFVSWPLYMAE